MVVVAQLQLVATYIEYMHTQVSPRRFFWSHGKRVFFHGCEKSCEGKHGYEAI